MRSNEKNTVEVKSRFLTRLSLCGVETVGCHHSLLFSIIKNIKIKTQWNLFQWRKMFQWNPSQMRQQAVYNNNNYFEDCNDPIPLEIERLHNVARFQMNVLRLIKIKLYIKTQFSWYLKTWCMILSNSNWNCKDEKKNVFYF